MTSQFSDSIGRINGRVLPKLWQINQEALSFINYYALKHNVLVHNHNVLNVKPLYCNPAKSRCIDSALAL